MSESSKSEALHRKVVELAGVDSEQINDDRTVFTLETILDLDVIFERSKAQNELDDRPEVCHMSHLRDLYKNPSQTDGISNWRIMLLWTIKNGKLWYDHRSGRFGTSGYLPKAAEAIIQVLSEKVKSIQKQIGIDPALFDGVKDQKGIIVYKKTLRYLQDIPVLHENWKLLEEDIYAESIIFRFSDTFRLTEPEILEMVKSAFNLKDDARLTTGSQSIYFFVNFNFKGA